jgi:predicted aspartyl protease
MHFPTGVTDVRLPARFDDGGVIIVRLTINGRGLDFQLDSGAAGIVLDADVAQQLGLPTFGQLTAATAGTYKASQTIVPQVQIGDLTMNDVAIDCLPFNAQPDRHTRIVGLLGYDFFAGAVVKVDYEHQTVDAYDPAAFPALKGEFFEMPIELDDRQPMVTARLGDAEGGTFIVDTGAFGVLVFPPFVDAHRQDLSYEVFGFGSFTFMPLIFSSGVGGQVGLRPMIASAFHFADVGFDDFEVYEAVAKSDFVGEDNDGLIGYEFLRYFNVYFDYKDSMLLFQPNGLLAGHKSTGS